MTSDTALVAMGDVDAGGDDADDADIDYDDDDGGDDWGNILNTCHFRKPQNTCPIWPLMTADV